LTASERLDRGARYIRQIDLLRRLLTVHAAPEIAIGRAPSNCWMWT
jgi:hypothetical protein